MRNIYKYNNHESYMNKKMRLFGISFLVFIIGVSMIGFVAANDINSEFEKFWNGLIKFFDTIFS